MGQKIVLAVIVIIAMFPVLVPIKIFPGSTYLSLCSLIFLVLSTLQWKNRDPRLVRLSPISFSILLFYGWGTMGYFYTGSLDFSYASIVQYLGALFLYLGLITNVKNDTELHKFIWFGLFCAAIHSLSLVFQVIPPGWAFDKSWAYDTSGTIIHFRNPNIVNSYILLFFPLAFYLRCYSSLRALKGLADCLFVFLLVVFWIPGSRAGEGAMIIQLMAVGAYLWKKKDKEGAKSLVVLFLVAAIVYNTAIFVSNKLSSGRNTENSIGQNTENIIGQDTGNSIGQNTENSTNQSTDRAVLSLSIRIYYWKGAWEIIKDHWRTGTGPATFNLVAPLYLYEINDQRSIDVGAVSFMNPPSAHNMYLQFASDLGIIGFGLFLVLIYFMYSKIYCLFRYTKCLAPELTFYIAVSITGYLLHNFFEFNWYTSEFIYTFTILIFIVDFNARKYLSTSLGPKNLYSRVFPVVVWGIIFIGGAVTLNYYFYLKTIKSDDVFAGQRVAQLEKNIDRAKELCPRCADPLLMKGKRLLNEYFSTLNPSLLAAAKEEFDKAIQNNPFDLRALPYLVQSHALQGSFQKAKEICYKLFKYHKYELTGRTQFAMIILVESIIAKNPSSGPKQIVEAWKQARELVVDRRKRIVENFKKSG